VLGPSLPYILDQPGLPYLIDAPALPLVIDDYTQPAFRLPMDYPRMLGEALA